MGIKHAFQTTKPDDPAADVSANEWNADHVIEGPLPASAVIGDAPPASPVEGLLWWDSTDGNLYLHYSDGTSSQWVPAVSGGQKGDTGLTGPKGNTGATGPAGPPGPWTQMTQAQYDALPSKDPNVLYVVIG